MNKNRVPLRRGLAFSNSTKNPPLVKSRNITSQNSFNWRQMFYSSPNTGTSTGTGTKLTQFAGNPPSPLQSQQFSPLLGQQAESFDTSLLTFATYDTCTHTQASGTSTVMAPPPPPSPTPQTQPTQPAQIRKLRTNDDIAEEGNDQLMHE